MAVFLQGEPEPIEGSHLLIAAGRQAVVEGLGLEGPASRSMHPASWPTGGCKRPTGGSMPSAIAPVEQGRERASPRWNHHAGLVIRNALFRLPARVGQAPIPRVLYTDPELAAVGLTEAEARERHGAIQILRCSFSENDRAWAEGTTEGHVKAVVTPRGRILGCTIAGAHADELIMPWVLALTKGLTVSDLAGLVYPYPTFSEVTKSTAVEFLKPSAQNPWLRRAIGLLRRLG
ncbi:NAD(P)/FAD-dependent oxidoreductase [Microvirga vignae]|uniref:NAD(P)/FAD-dependent oxidoreductase n=1 Tax=Microvirga vignae TaxID=1225564 RepID=UPI00069C734A|nr:NAD(P)/FAD-dependent oxidoreductase [Microvirga vignae]